jgi:hypothetical protein
VINLDEGSEGESGGASSAESLDSLRSSGSSGSSGSTSLSSSSDARSIGALPFFDCDMLQPRHPDCGTTLSESSIKKKGMSQEESSVEGNNSTGGMAALLNSRTFILLHLMCVMCLFCQVGLVFWAESLNLYT